MNDIYQSHLCQFCQYPTSIFRIISQQDPFHRVRICNTCLVSYFIEDEKLLRIQFMCTIKEHKYLWELNYQKEISCIWTNTPSHFIQRFTFVPQGLTPYNVSDKLKIYLPFL